MTDEADESPESNEEAAEPESEEPDPLAEATAQAAKYKDMALRSAADFDNYRKRARREVEDSWKLGREDLIKELLPVFDNLERGVQSAQKATEVKGVADGLTMVLKQFQSTLGKLAINRIPTTGSAFDPSLHEAIQQVETDEHPPGTIVAEVQPGYTSADRLIRAAMVVVAKPKSQGPADPS
jgi:molecular chaperone GrpE